MNLLRFVANMFAPRPQNDAAAIRNSKLIKELGDCAFRIAQMWIVVTLVKLFYDSSHHWAAGIVYFFLLLVLAFYALLAPRGFILEWESANGRQDKPPSIFALVLILVFAVYAAAPLLYFEEVIAVVHEATAKIAPQVPGPNGAGQH